MDIDKEIQSLAAIGYYVDFEMGSDNEYTCFIADGCYQETISKSVVGEGKTLTESFKDAVNRLKIK